MVSTESIQNRRHDMKVIIQTATDRYVFPEAECIEIENTTTLHFAADEDLPGIVITEVTEDEK